MTELATIPLRERPIERLYFYGGGALSSRELLASLVGGSHQIEVAGALLETFHDITGIAKAPIAQLNGIAYLGRAGAARLKAALEFGRRLTIEDAGDRPLITSPSEAANLVMMEMSLLDQEHLRLILLDTKNRVLETPTVYIGNLNTSIIRVGEVFRYALTVNCASIIVVHNHPSGDPTPSPEDVRVTERIVQAGHMLDVDVLDHLIIGGQRFVSLKERGLGFK